MKRPNAKVIIDSDHTVSALATQAHWDNEQLVDRAIAGDPVAENAIYRKHVRFLLNLATRLTRCVSDGDDVVQDTFVVAFRKLYQLENPDALRTWLTRILVSQIRRRLRVRKLQSFFGLKLAASDATLRLGAVHDARPDLRAELEELNAVLQQTPDKLRITWMLHRVEGMSIRETAQATKYSVATVKRHIAAVDVAVQSNRRVAP